MMQHESGNSPPGASAAVPAAFTISSRQRDPPGFSGRRGEDVDDWLYSYNRVSSFNRWEDALKLRIVFFSLPEAAKTWFINYEHTIADWTNFTQELLKNFGTPCIRADVARQPLVARIQRPEKKFASYIEDVVALCHRVDEAMPEADKVRHVLKGIAPFAFNALAVENPASVSDVRKTCQRLDQLQSIRLRQEACASHQHGDSDLPSLIRVIIREELQQQDSPCSSRDHCHTSAPELRDIVREELTFMKGYSPARFLATVCTKSYSPRPLPWPPSTRRPTLRLRPNHPCRFSPRRRKPM